MFAKIAINTVFFIFITNWAYAEDCYQSSIMTPNPFMGNNGEIFKLADGSLWEVKYEYEYLYEYSPDVIICPLQGKLAIKGKTLNIERIGTKSLEKKSNNTQVSSTEIIESQIDGEFSGWSGETIFKLTNGQIWQQAAYAYTYTYKYNPKILIFRTSIGYEMKVEGLDRRVRVIRLQ